MKITHLILLFLIFLLTFSCCDKGETFRLGELENQFIPYDVSDTIHFKNLESEEVIELMYHSGGKSLAFRRRL